jgi:putative Holliday junction resolvase
MRTLGLDLGDKRIGVAICDTAGTVATPYETLKRVGDRPVEHDLIAAIVADLEAEAIVVGMPYGLDGSVGAAAKKVASEVKALRKRFDIPVETHDERNSTVSAAANLRTQGVKAKRQPEMIDQVAAAVILQSWLDARVPPRVDGGI